MNEFTPQSTEDTDDNVSILCDMLDVYSDQNSIISYITSYLSGTMGEIIDNDNKCDISVT